MANEAATTLILRMQDEASTQMENFAQTTQSAEIEAIQFNAALTAVGSALTAVGSLVGQIDSPMAKLASTFLVTGGAILTTTSAIIQALPYIRQLIGSLRNLAITRAVLAAFSGPGGWIGLGIGAAAGGAAVYGITRATRPQGSNVTVNNYVQGSVVTERQMAENTRRSIVKTQNRNTTSGIR